MRKVEEQVITSFLRGESARKGNTHTDGRTLFLHDNAIAMIDRPTNSVAVTMAGWSTVTTRSRLNALFSLAGIRARVGQSNHEQVMYMHDRKEPQYISNDEIIVLPLGE